MALEQPASAGFAALQPFAGDRPAEQRAGHSCPFSSALEDDDFAEGYCQHFRDKPAAHRCEAAQDEIPGARTSAGGTCRATMNLSREKYNQANHAALKVMHR